MGHAVYRDWLVSFAYGRSRLLWLVDFVQSQQTSAGKVHRLAVTDSRYKGKVARALN
jgi:hypothetical protein